MSIDPVCDRCDDPLTEPGGLLFSPPGRNGLVSKLHVCPVCWDYVVENLMSDVSGRLPQPGEPTMSLLHPEVRGLFER